MAALGEALNKLERVLFARYDVRSLDGVGSLGVAMSAARKGDLSLIDEAMTDREMYRFHDAAHEALAAAHEALEGDEDEETPPATADDSNTQSSTVLTVVSSGDASTTTTTNAETATTPTASDDGLDEKSFKELQAIATSMGLKSVGVKQAALIESIREAKKPQT